MYQPLSASRQSLDREDDRAGSRRGSGMATGQHRPSFSAHSPTRSHFGISSLTSANGSYERANYDHRHHHHHHPSTPAPLPLSSTAPSTTASQQTSAVRHGHSSPTNGLAALNGSAFAPREKTVSTFYDPTSDQGDAPSSWTHASYTRHSPLQPPQQPRRESGNYQDAAADVNSFDRHRQSPPTTSHFRHHSPPYSSTRSHPSSRIGSISQSPIKTSRESPVRYHDYGYTAAEPPASALKSPSITSEKHDRTPNPMAFSSILSDANPEPRMPPASPPAPAPVREARKASKPSASQAPPEEDRVRVLTPRVNARPAPSHSTRTTADRSAKARLVSDAVSVTPTSAVPAKRKKKSAQTSKDRATARMVAAVMDDSALSDLDLPEFDEDKLRFRQRSAKRMLEVAEAETRKRKRRRIAFTGGLSSLLRRCAEAGEARFQARFGPDVAAEVHEMEVQDEKERKKDLQRKRRREKTVQNEVQKRDEAIQRAQNAADEAEREKYRKEAERADKKAKATRKILEGRGAEPDEEVKELREVTPLAPNLEGGTMTSFNTAAELDSEPPKKKPARSSNRPRKSKEQKQAEKDAAEAAHAAMENDEPLPATPKEDRRETASKKEAAAPAPPPFVPYVSKTYHQIYDQIWRDMARKDIPRVHKLKDSSLAIKQANCRKTAQLASKEARRWQVRTNKSLKEVQGRAKRSMREMMSFWKQNEKQERDLRRIAERQELENAKRAEAEREANRQRRKLNFLISQTELYSHFIGRKIKTDEVERSTDSADVAVSGQVLQSGPTEPPATTTTASMPEIGDAIGPKVTNFENLDFDDDDESKLQAIAAANAQSAIQEAQDRARAFDAEGELNFQNPTSLGETNVAQPEMLNAQLKEYQLKGLNWLVNLYEQGINGILADEMGLGKTVQSISVMAYLAESHNIWGPFLVVAPASTLHNWQQEISKFVPKLKTLPYWGTAKDRRVLRKFWDRKHVTYNLESSFHVLVTSYQLVVQDAQYLQKIKWQYMILDEAQAIKSSESSRWKCLLNFHSRNRLLLTGTPIQNNMQELWALLHFIMPSLFDSHDEFSDWFSKDIESHAQSNTKLNEDQLKRLHMILKPFMLRRIKKHVQKELGDKLEEDVACDLTYRQRAYYGNLRDRISVADLIEKGARGGNDQDVNTLMNLVMQFRKVCNHPDLFERAETTSPLSVAHFAETASFLREGHFVNLGYSTRNLIEYRLPRLVYRRDGRIHLPDRANPQAGFRGKYLNHLLNIWNPEHIQARTERDGAFSWLRFVPASASELSDAFHSDLFSRAVKLAGPNDTLGRLSVVYDDEENRFTPATSLLAIMPRNDRRPVMQATTEGYLRTLMNVSADVFERSGLSNMEQCARPAASAPPIELVCSSRGAEIEKHGIFFNVPMRRLLYGVSEIEERQVLQAKLDRASFPPFGLLPAPVSDKARYTNIRVPSMRRFVTDCGKLARLDGLLRDLKEGGHRVLLYFQMTRMMDLMEEYLTYRNYKYLRLDGSTSLEDRRDRVHDFQTRPEIFVFVLSTRAGGLGINLTAADTVIFYDSDWNPTIDSQAMDRAHRLGQTRQVTVYRMITRGTIEERIRKRAMQKEEVQRVVISGGSGAGVDFNTRSKENRTKEVAMWLADDDQAAQIEQREAELLASTSKDAESGKKKKGAATKKQQPRKTELSLEEMYHEGEGNFDDNSNNRPSGTVTPVPGPSAAAAGTKRKRAGTTSAPKKGNGGSGGAANGGGSGGGSRNKRARTTKERLSMADGGD